ncbi:MAG: hypothetical protein AABN33_02585 [Acidobacteriota bacterium]
MSRKPQMTVLAIAFAVIPFATALAAEGRIEAVGAYADPGASDALKKALEAKGWRITLSDGAYCDIWLRAAVPGGKTDAAGAVYTWIGDSTLIGVITLARATTDFRGQSLKPGSYTLRYAVHPADGNHMGISPIRDFLVMLPLATDPSPDAQFKFEELTKMSTKVSGTSHPGILSLIQLASAPAAPKLETDEHNNLVFSAAIKNQSGAAMPISFVVKGHAEQ